MQTGSTPQSPVFIRAALVPSLPPPPPLPSALRPLRLPVQDIVKYTTSASGTGNVILGAPPVAPSLSVPGLSTGHGAEPAGAVPKPAATTSDASVGDPAVVVAGGVEGAGAGAGVGGGGDPQGDIRLVDELPVSITAPTAGEAQATEPATVGTDMGRGAGGSSAHHLDVPNRTHTPEYRHTCF